jgi:hypothetical protein
LKATAYKWKSSNIHKALAMGFHSDIPLANFMTFERAPLAIAGKLNKEAPSTSKLIYSQHFLHSKE